MPLTPPQTPLEPAHDTPFQVFRTDGEDVLVPEMVSLVTVRYRDLPFCQAIAATTPSLHVQMDRLSLTLEFVEVFSGQLSIAQAEDATVWTETRLILY